MKSFKNILLINFGGIGDEILFLPVIDSLKKEYSNAKITLCLEERSSAFLKLTNNIDSYFFVDIKTKNKYFQMLKLYFKAFFGRYDLVISSGANPLISALLFSTGIKTRIGYKTSRISTKLLTNAVPLNKNQYAARMYFDLIKPIINSEFAPPRINIEVKEKLANSVLIHPGVSKISIQKNITKTISPQKWAEIIIELLKVNKKVYLAGGPDDTECIEEIRNKIKDIDQTNFKDIFGKTKNIFELVELITKCETLICSDSAPMHIGVATNTKTIAIFGPTEDETLLPKSEKFIAIKNDTECRPCLWKKRQTTCDKLRCLEIDINKIIELI